MKRIKLINNSLEVIEEKKYLLKTDGHYLRTGYMLGKDNKDNKFVDPEGGPMMIVDTVKYDKNRKGYIITIK
jgi:hypothetical protein